ncbi:MAG: lasso peptide biosynthesis B2 protein [Chloroflexi bacterium]|nr:lasso peptide biosynthesis B2 protein [Chloroflexota bacterium]
MRNWFRSLRRRLRTLRQLSWADRLLLAEALVMLGLARLAVVALPFRWIAARLDAAHSPTARVDRSKARRVGVAIRRVARITPWRSKCLEQAVAGYWMLRRRDLPGVLHLGVAKEDEVMEAHAWLHCGNQIITGGQDVQRFSVVARFGERGR